jgi:hypothetical protein
VDRLLHLFPLLHDGFQGLAGDGFLLACLL